HLDLQQTRLAKQAEVGRHHPYRTAGQVDIRDQRAARLKTRQLQLMDVLNQTFAHKHHVAVPPVPAVSVTDRHSNQAGFSADAFEIEPRGALAEPAIDLLQCDHVGIDLGDHRAHAFGVVASVDANTFVDIVRGESDF